jgi:hypothetical protein
MFATAPVAAGASGKPAALHMQIESWTAQLWTLWRNRLSVTG